MKIGVLVTGDVAVRAAHSLSTQPWVDDVVVIGPARSKSFEVVDTVEGCDYLLGSGSDAPKRASKLGVPLIWDGEGPAGEAHIWGASPQGLTLALASREEDLRLVAVAHPDLESGKDHKARFPDPIGKLEISDSTYGGQRLAVAESPNQFAACLAIGRDRRVTIIDDGDFLSGVALAAGAAIAADGPRPVWEEGLAYLQAATAMGLVMAEDV